MEQIKQQLLEAAQVIINDIQKDTKVAAARVRKATLAISKIGKEYRKMSIAAQKK